MLSFLAGCQSSLSADPSKNSLDQTPTAENIIPDSAANEISLVKTISGHQGRVLDAVFSPDGLSLATSGQDRKIRLWDTSSGKELTTFQMHSVDMADIDISLDGKHLASGEAIWDLTTYEEIQILERGSIHPTMIGFSPDNSSIAVARFDQGVEIWNILTGEIVFSLEVGDDTRTKSMQFSPDGVQLAAGVMDGSIRIWDIQSGTILHTLHSSGETDIHDLAYSENGKYLAAVGRLTKAVVWETSNWEVLDSFPLRDHGNGVDFSTNGTLLAISGGAEQAVMIYQLASGELLQTLILGEQSMAVRFSPDGRYLAAGLFDGQILLWEIPSGTK
jgi:WD40 repeat protein